MEKIYYQLAQFALRTAVDILEVERDKITKVEPGKGSELEYMRLGICDIKRALEKYEGGKQ